MIVTVGVILFAFLWLGKETSWLTIRLGVGETLQDFDRRTLAIIKLEWELRQRQEDIKYQTWLDKRYAPKLVRGFGDRQSDYPQYAWMSTETDLQNRRDGRMIYQRGR